MVGLPLAPHIGFRLSPNLEFVAFKSLKNKKELLGDKNALEPIFAY